MTDLPEINFDRVISSNSIFANTAGSFTAPLPATMGRLYGRPNNARPCHWSIGGGLSGSSGIMGITHSGELHAKQMEEFGKDGFVWSINEILARPTILLGMPSLVITTTSLLQSDLPIGGTLPE